MTYRLFAVCRCGWKTQAPLGIFPILDCCPRCGEPGPDGVVYDFSGVWKLKTMRRHWLRWEDV
jgi:hypothetical protein